MRNTDRPSPVVFSPPEAPVSGFSLPADADIDQRLREMLAADSTKTGGQTARLMFMLTRSCELRCAYCFVALTEEGHGRAHPGTAEAGGRIPTGDMSRVTALRGVDWLMSSERPRLAMQFFGGEPARAWDALVEAIGYAGAHPRRGGRPLEILLTTNGLGFSPQRLAQLAGHPVTLQVSVDGWGAGNRFRVPHLLPQADADARWEGLVGALSGHRWFLNVTLPPAAAGEGPARYAEARARGVPALQLNYATGVTWAPEQFRLYLESLASVYASDHARPGFTFFNWQHGADPAPLCGDVILDVDGTLLQVGGIFHERRFAALRAAYHHGHLDDGVPADRQRARLADLWVRTQGALSVADLRIFENGMRLGAAADLVGRQMKTRLGR